MATLLATIEAPRPSSSRTAVSTSHAAVPDNSVARMRVLAEEKRILALEVQLIEAELKLRRIDRIMTEINCQMAEEDLKREERQLVDLEISLLEAQIAVKKVNADMKDLSAVIPKHRVTEIVDQVYQGPPSPVRRSPKRSIRTLMPGSSAGRGENALPSAPLGSSSAATTGGSNPPKSLLKGKMATILSRFEREIGKNQQVDCQSKSFVSVAVGQAMRFTRRPILPVETGTPTTAATSAVLPDTTNRPPVIVQGPLDEDESDDDDSSHDLRIPLSEQLTIPQTPDLDHADEEETLIEVVDDDDDDDNWTVHSYAVSLIHNRKAREDDDLVSLQSERDGLKHELSSIRRAELQAEVDAGDDDYDVDDEVVCRSNHMMPTSLFIQPSESCLLHHSKRQLLRSSNSNLNNSSSSFLEFSFSSIATEEVFHESFVGSYVASLSSSRSPRQRSNPSLGNASIMELEFEDDEDDEEEEAFEEVLIEETSRSGSYMESSKDGDESNDVGDGGKNDSSFSLSCREAEVEVSSVGSNYLQDQIETIPLSKSATKRVPSRMVSMLNSASLQSALLGEFDEGKYDEDEESQVSRNRKDTFDYGYEEHAPSIKREEVKYGYEEHAPSAREIAIASFLEHDTRLTRSRMSKDDEDSNHSDRENAMSANVDYGYEDHEHAAKDASEGEESENCGRPICRVGDPDDEDPENSMLAIALRSSAHSKDVDYGYEDHEPSAMDASEDETETEVSEYWGMPTQVQDVFGQDDESSDDEESGNDYLNPLLMAKGSLKQTAMTPLQRAASSRKLAVEEHDQDELEEYREGHEKKGFKSITSEAASLGRLTRLKEKVTEALGQKEQKRGTSRRASIVASSLLDIQWKSSHHNFTREVSEIAAVYQRSEHVVTSHTRKSAESDDSDAEDFFEDYESSASEDDDNGAQEPPSRVEAIVKQCKEEDNEKNSKMVQHLQDMEDPDDVELPEDRAPRTQSIIRQRQQAPRALRRCSIGTITRTLTQEAMSSAQERQARIDQGQFHMKGQCSCPYCFTASPFQTYAYMEQEQKREDKPPPGTWSRKNGKWGRHKR